MKSEVYKMQLELKLLSGLHKVYPEECPDWENPVLTAFVNEPLSFQIAYKADVHNLPFLPRFETELPLQLYEQRYVTVLHNERHLVPDILLEKNINPPIEQQRSGDDCFWFEKDEKTMVAGTNQCWQVLWITINPKEIPVKPGSYSITLQCLSRKKGENVGTVTVPVQIYDAQLPPQTTYYTNWFHCDCLADYYGVEIFSQRFFEIMEKHLRVAAEHGMNMVLMPAFTPSLDIPEGGERKTAQLVGVTKENGEYHFDFSLMERFIAVARKAGIAHFEHSHLFTQWGATHVPKVMANVDGVDCRLFAPEEPADGAPYTEFLRAYLPELRAFLQKEGILSTTLFHISDEPQLKNEQSYRAARRIVENYLGDCMLGDALWDYTYYEKGLASLPIVSLDRVPDFYGRCDNFWCYYIGSLTKGQLSNRLLWMSHERNRMLGTQMFWYGIKGFLQWGYNYMYHGLSNGFADPNIDTGYQNGNPGTSYIVYPAANGDCRPSIRQKVFQMGLVDIRALQLLEQRHGREKCNAVIREFFGELTIFDGPATPEQMLQFRQTVNDAVVEEKRLHN